MTDTEEWLKGLYGGKNMIRTKRKNCIKEIGLEEFKFDYGKELSIYLFAKGEYLIPKRMKIIDIEKRFNSHEEWRNYIRDKYKFFSKNKLEEFRRYLVHKERRHRPIAEFTGPYISALLSAFMSYFVSYFVTEEIVAVKLEIEPIYKILLFCFAFVVLFSTFVWVVAGCMKLFISNGVEEGFLEDYMEVITEMLKENQFDKETEMQKVKESLEKMELSIEKLQKNVKDINTEIEQIHEQFKESNKKEVYYDRKCEEKKNNACKVIIKALNRHL